MENYYRVGQAAEMLGATPHHVRVLCQRGLIPGVQTTSSGHYRIPESAIDKMARDGVPPIPAGTDHGRTAPGSPPSPPRSSERSGLFAEASEKVIEAQEDVVIAERRVKKRSLDLQLEEIEDRFREREAKAEEAEAKRQEAEEASRSEVEHRKWVDKWTQTGLAQLPWDYPTERRSEVIEKLRSKLTSGNAGQSDVLTWQVVKSIVAGFTRPWERAQDVERLVERSIPFELRSDLDLEQAAHEAAWKEIQRLGIDCNDRMLEGAVEQACKPLILQRRYRETCNRLVGGVWGELPSAMSREIELAKHAVMEVLSTAETGTPPHKLEQMRDEALAPFKNVIRSRQDQETRERLLSNTLALCYGIPGAEVEHALREVRDAFRQLTNGTTEAELRKVRDAVFARYKRKHSLIDNAAGNELGTCIRKLEEQWEFDKSTWTLQFELADVVRRGLTEQLDGTEPEEQVNKLMRQIVRQELDIG